MCTVSTSKFNNRLASSLLIATLLAGNETMQQIEKKQMTDYVDKRVIYKKWS